MNLHTTKMSSKVLLFASQAHKSVNHKYGDQEYVYHLSDVINVAFKFKHLIGKDDEDDQDVVIQACSCHDLIEDTRLTYNDVKDNIRELNRNFIPDSKLDKFAEQVAEIVYALTNEKGRTRKERANHKYYQGIKNTKYAVFVKLCDRIANVQYSKSLGNKGMFEMYKKEQPMFEMSLKDNNSVELYNEMFEYLNKIVYE